MFSASVQHQTNLSRLVHSHCSHNHYTKSSSKSIASSHNRSSHKASPNPVASFQSSVAPMLPHDINLSTHHLYSWNSSDLLLCTSLPAPLRTRIRKYPSNPFPSFVGSPFCPIAVPPVSLETFSNCFKELRNFQHCTLCVPPPVPSQTLSTSHCIANTYSDFTTAFSSDRTSSPPPFPVPSLSIPRVETRMQARLTAWEKAPNSFTNYFAAQLTLAVTKEWKKNNLSQEPNYSSSSLLCTENILIARVELAVFTTVALLSGPISPFSSLGKSHLEIGFPKLNCHSIARVTLVRVSLPLHLLLRGICPLETSVQTDSGIVVFPVSVRHLSLGLEVPDMGCLQFGHTKWVSIPLRMWRQGHGIRGDISRYEMVRSTSASYPRQIRFLIIRKFHNV